MIPTSPFCGAWNGINSTASANTIINQVVPPFLGNSGPPNLFSVAGAGTAANTANPGTPSWIGGAVQGAAFTHITDVIYTTVTTVHQLYFMSPLNWTTQLSDMTSSSTTMALSADPGTWQVAGVYKYNTVIPTQASNAIAASDYVVYQLNDGRWVVDKVASGSGTAPVLTTGIPAVTGAKLLAGSPVFWYGVATDTNPFTGTVHPFTDVPANTRQVMSTYGVGLYNSLRRNDPMIIQSSNGTNAGTFELLTAYYSNLG